MDRARSSRDLDVHVNGTVVADESRAVPEVVEDGGRVKPCPRAREQLEI